MRARHDRKLPAGGTLFAAADGWPNLGIGTIKAPPRGPGDKRRTAKVAIRASRVQLGKPEAKVRTPDPEAIDIGLVEVRELDPHKGVKTVAWRLLTTLPVATLSLTRGHNESEYRAIHQSVSPGSAWGQTRRV